MSMPETTTLIDQATERMAQGENCDDLLILAIKAKDEKAIVAIISQPETTTFQGRLAAERLLVDAREFTRAEAQMAILLIEAKLPFFVRHGLDECIAGFIQEACPKLDGAREWHEIQEASKYAYNPKPDANFDLAYRLHKQNPDHPLSPIVQAYLGQHDFMDTFPLYHAFGVIMDVRTGSEIYLSSRDSLAETLSRQKQTAARLAANTAG